MTSWKSNGVFWCGGGGVVVGVAIIMFLLFFSLFSFSSGDTIYNEIEREEIMIDIHQQGEDYR